MYRTIAVLITNLCFLSIFSSCKFSAHITLHFSLCFENQEKGKYISKGEQDQDTGPKYYFKSLLFSSSFSVSFNVLMVFILACFSTFNSFLLFEFTSMSFHEIGDKNLIHCYRNAMTESSRIGIPINPCCNQLDTVVLLCGFIYLFL